MLAMALSVPKAIPILRCFVGVTKKCSRAKIAAKSAQPKHKSHVQGCESANHTNRPTLTRCSKALITNDVVAEKCEGMECRPRLRSNSAS